MSPSRRDHQTLEQVERGLQRDDPPVAARVTTHSFYPPCPWQPGVRFVAGGFALLAGERKDTR